MPFWDWLINNAISIHCGLLMLVGLIVFFKTLNPEELLVGVTMLIFIAGDIITSVVAYQQQPNLWLYNILLFPQLVCTVLVLTSRLTQMKLKLFLNGGMWFIALLHILNLLWGQTWSHFANFTYLPATAWMAVTAYFYLRQRFEEIDTPPFSHWITWFAIGVMIDNAATLPILSLLGWSDFLSQPLANNLYAIVTWLYAGWYLTILFGLLWTRTSLRSLFSSR